MNFLAIFPYLLRGRPVKRETWSSWICRDPRENRFIRIGTDAAYEREFGPLPVTLTPEDLEAVDWRVWGPAPGRD